MSERYKVTVEEDNDSGAVSWIILAALIVLCFVFVGIPLLVGYIIYLIIKYYKKQKALEPLRCPVCGKSNALRSFKSEVVERKPKQLHVHARQTGALGGGDVLTVWEERTRHYEKCRFCGEIQYHDTVREV